MVPHAKDVCNPVLKAFTGSLLTISTQNGLPPGSRVQFDLPVSSGEESIPITGKVVSVAPEAGGCFLLVIRLHSLTRKQSALLSMAATG